MKTIKILASALAILALNINSFAADNSKNLQNSIEKNKNDISSFSFKNGRNKSITTNQDNTDLQFIAKESNEDIFSALMPKGRNLEMVKNIEENNSSYAKSGRNDKTMNEMISMQ